MKKIIKFIPAIVLGIFLGQTVIAADFVAPQSKDDPNVTISASESYHNLYVSGANVNVNGDTSGDLYAAGVMVNLVGDVEEDANIMGGSLSISGSIGGDARIVGGNITINSPIGGDLLLAGGNLNINDTAVIAEDAAIAGGNVSLNAPVSGSLKIAGGNITINSKVDGDVNVKSTQSLTFGPEAEVLGKIYYEGPKEAVVAQGAKVSNIEFKLVKPQSRNMAGFMAGSALIKLLAWFLAAWLLLHFFRPKLEYFYAEVNGRPWSSLGIGLAGVVLTPLVAILLLFTLVGYYLAILLGVSFVLLMLVASLASAIFLAFWLMQKIFKQNAWPNWLIALTGSFVWMILYFVPIIGAVICGLIFLMVFGSAVRAFRHPNQNNSEIQ